MMPEESLTQFIDRLREFYDLNTMRLFDLREGDDETYSDVLREASEAGYQLEVGSVSAGFVNRKLFDSTGMGE